MEIQKEREAFENWWEALHNGRQIACDYVEEDNSYSVGYANAQWVAWQAAKAIREGFVLVPKNKADDSERMDFLADRNQSIANVVLPASVVERNLSSLRDAIDEARMIEAQGRK